MEGSSKQHLYWNLFVYNQWQMYMAATADGLCYVGSQNKGFDELAQWAKSRLPTYVLVRDAHRLQLYTNQFIEYFQGQRTVFTFPLDFYGTPFQLTVWNALCNIPYGCTYSYLDIATHIQKPRAVRAVGSAIGANPLLVVIPCHRVIGKNGKLTGYRGGLRMKQDLLFLEKAKTAVKTGGLGLPSDPEVLI